MKAGTVGEIVGEASGKGGARKFRVAVMSSKGEGGNVNGKQKKANKGATDGESWYELAELAPHKVESVGYVAQGSLEDQRKAAEAHTLGLGVRGKGSWPLHLLYPDNREILMRLGEASTNPPPTFNAGLSLTDRCGVQRGMVCLQPRSCGTQSPQRRGEYANQSPPQCDTRDVSFLRD